MKKLISTSVLSLLVGFASFGQIEDYQKKCATYTQMEEVFEMYPQLEKHYYAQELLNNSLVVNSEGKANDSTYIIPVVVHIIHEYGAENISDQAAYDLMEALNREFNAADPDSVDLVPEYQSLHGNGNIEFRLAAIDPYGNCTNGIEHIYSHETRIGDAFSKLHQWNRAHYLNIWSVDVVGTPGAAAYATPPASTDGSGFWVDGVLSQYSHFVSQGWNESVITHEVGHYFNLKHVWGDMDLINNPPSVCGDDGVEDTPITMGWLSPCPMSSYPAGWIVCDTAGVIVEDVQNYMEYSYCDRHFTPGQVERMHNALEGIAGQRNQLWQDSTLQMTGVDQITLPQTALTVPLCVPVADFNTPDKTICVGDVAPFTDFSWNAVVDSRVWTFEGGNPATSTSANVNVTWDTPGWKKVTLAVTNAAGTDTRVENQYIFVAPDWPDYLGPTSLNMESNNHYFLVQNPEDNYGKFSVVNTATQGKAWKLQTYKDISQADPFTDEAFYNNRLGLTTDNLITPAFDLRNTTGITVSFKWSYATNATDPADITEVLKVYSSRDCGQTWTPRKTLTGSNLVTGGFASNADYAPTTSNQWQTESFTYTPTAADNKTRFKFEFVASDLASNLFIDDIFINGVLGLSDDVIANLALEVYPNPTSGEAINVSYIAQNEPTEFILRDVQGKIIAQQVISTTNAQVTQTLEGTENLASSYYFLEVKVGESSVTKKVVVL